MIISRSSLLAALLIAISGGGSIADEFGGVWLTEDGSSRVRFERCENGYCGQIIWLRDPVDPETGKAWLDKYNADPRLRLRTLLGLSIVAGLSLKGAGEWEGAVYNPLDGRTYAGTVKTIDHNHLRLTGCALAGLLCQSEAWARVAD